MRPLPLRQHADVALYESCRLALARLSCAAYVHCKCCMLCAASASNVFAAAVVCAACGTHRTGGLTSCLVQGLDVVAGYVVYLSADWGCLVSPYSLVPSRPYAPCHVSDVNECSRAHATRSFKMFASRCLQQAFPPNQSTQKLHGCNPLQGFPLLNHRHSKLV